MSLLTDISSIKYSNGNKHHWKNVWKICEADTETQNPYWKNWKYLRSRWVTSYKSDLKLEQTINILVWHLSNIKSILQNMKGILIIFLNVSPFCFTSQMCVPNWSLNVMSRNVLLFDLHDLVKLYFKVISIMKTESIQKYFTGISSYTTVIENL